MTNQFNYEEILRTWNTTKEQEKADFLEHMYHCAGRQNKSHPMHGLYTGLWHDFCITEAGPTCRNQFFEFLAAVTEFEEKQKEQLIIS